MLGHEHCRHCGQLHQVMVRIDSDLWCLACLTSYRPAEAVSLGLSLAQWMIERTSKPTFEEDLKLHD